MEKLAEPTLITPKLPLLTKVYKESEDQSYPDPDNQGQDITTKLMVTKTRPRDAVMVKMKMDIYILHYKVWVGEDKAWKTNRSRLYALVLMHCPPNLEEILKTISVWNVVSKAHNAIGLLKMVPNVVHDQTEAKQTVMGFVESIAEFFTYHQEEKTSGDDCSI